MDPEYDLARPGYPNELRRFTEMIEGVERGDGPLVITRQGRPVAVVIDLDRSDLLHQVFPLEQTKHSDDTRTVGQ